MPSKIWVEITYPFPIFNNEVIEALDWMKKIISHFVIDVITYPWLDWN